MSTSFMSNISDFQDDEFDSSTSFVSGDVPLTSTPCSTSPLAPSFSLVDDATDQSESTSTIIADDPYNDHPTIEAEPDNEWFGYKFLGDNVDGKIIPRLMRSDNQSEEFHYFHQFMLRDRTDCSHLSEAPPSVDPDAPLKELIPTVEDDQVLLANFRVLVTRELVRHMHFFSNNFSDCVVSHIPHVYSKEMAKKSEIVSSSYCYINVTVSSM